MGDEANFEHYDGCPAKESPLARCWCAEHPDHQSSLPTDRPEFARGARDAERDMKAIREQQASSLSDQHAWPKPPKLTPPHREQQLCARCGKPAQGHAGINGKRYCHEGDSPTCYEAQSHDEATPDETGAITLRMNETEVRVDGSSRIQMSNQDAFETRAVEILSERECVRRMEAAEAEVERMRRGLRRIIEFCEIDAGKPGLMGVVIGTAKGSLNE